MRSLHTAQRPACTFQRKRSATSTPKRCRHMISFAFLEVRFTSRIVRVGFASDLNVSLNGLDSLRHSTCTCRFPERLWNRLATNREDHRRSKGSSLATLKRLAISVFWVEVLPFLPKSERNGCHLARQRETRHGRLFASRQRRLVEVLERSRTHTGHGRPRL
jgi:hypothetical protein